jgi:hypothetical protein
MLGISFSLKWDFGNAYILGNSSRTTRVTFFET